MLFCPDRFFTELVITPCSYELYIDLKRVEQYFINPQPCNLTVCLYTYLLYIWKETLLKTYHQYHKMLPFFVLCSVFYTFLTSLILSVILLIRCTVSRLFGFFPNRFDDSISLYEGTVCHERRHPLSHSFKMSVRYALIDLDRSFYVPPNHLSAKEARSIAGTKGPVYVLS